MLYSDNLPIVKDLPSPEGKWELVEVIGEALSCTYVCVCVCVCARVCVREREI